MNEEIKGILVFYINVGMLPPSEAEEFINRWRDRIKFGHQNDFESIPALKIPSTIDSLFIPVRDKPTQVEYIPFDGVTKDALSELIEVKILLNQFMNEPYKVTPQD